MTRLFLLLAALSVVPLTASAKKGDAAPAANLEQARDEELGSLRRQLAAAVLVAELKLSGEQKTALRTVLAEARRLRDEKRADPKLLAFRADRKQALQKAIDEVHAKGELSDATRTALREGAKDAREGLGDSWKGKAKELHASVKGILNEAQLETLDSMRTNQKKQTRLGAKAQRGRMRKLLLSKELDAELAR